MDDSKTKSEPDVLSDAPRPQDVGKGDEDVETVKEDNRMKFEQGSKMSWRW